MLSNTASVESYFPFSGDAGSEWSSGSAVTQCECDLAKAHLKFVLHISVASAIPKSNALEGCIRCVSLRFSAPLR
jgi:hypothetical protein